MCAKRFYRSLAVLAVGIAASASVTCNPFYGSLELFRYDDHNDFYYDDFFAPDIYIDECFFFDCYF